MRKLLLLLAFWLLCCFAPLCRAQPTLTTIQDTLYNVDGSLMDGNIIVTNAAFSVGGVPIARGARAFPITNGVVNIQLAPDGSREPGHRLHGEHGLERADFDERLVGADAPVVPLPIGDLHHRASHDALHARPDDDRRALAALHARRYEWAAHLR